QVATRAGMSLVHFYLVVRFIQVRPRQLVRCFAPALETTAIMAVAVLALRPLLAAWAPRPALAALTLAGAAVYLLVLTLRYPRIVRTVRQQLRALSPALAGADRGRGAAAVPEPALATAEALPLGVPIASTAAEPRA
ncbi:MAG: hypothetical protein ACRD1L_09850, partial [Terriglobales bacterium]